MWRAIRDELVAAVLVVPALVLMVVLAWYQYPEEPVSYRVIFTLVAALLVVAFVVVFVAVVIYGV